MNKEENTNKENQINRSVDNTDYKVLYIQALADYQNLQKRNSKLIESVKRDTKVKIIKELINVYDAAKQGAEYNEQGPVLIFNAFKRALNNLNIKIIDEEFMNNLVTKHKFNEDFFEGIVATRTTDKTKDKTINTIMADGFYDEESKTTLIHAKVSVWRYENLNSND